LGQAKLIWGGLKALHYLAIARTAAGRGLGRRIDERPDRREGEEQANAFQLRFYGAVLPAGPVKLLLNKKEDFLLAP